MTPAGNAILTQLSASYRHLAVEDKCHKAFLDSNCLEAWAHLIEVFPTNQDVIFNVLRTLSKLSNYESVCIKLNEKKACLKGLSGFFKFYKSNIHIIIRIAIIFAYFFLYPETWHHIYRIFDHSYISIMEPGRISMNVSTITQEESYRVKTKLKKWDWVWQLGITNISKNNQIYSAPSESSDWSLTCWQYLQSAKISTSTNPIAIENSPKN